MDHKPSFGIELPSQYAWEQRGRTTMAVLRSYRERLLALPLEDLDALLRVPGVDRERFRGRGQVASIEIDSETGERMIVRSYRHGGVFRALTGKTLLGPQRPFAELCAGSWAWDKGVPTARVLGASVERRFGCFFRGALFTREISGGQDLDRVFRDLPSNVGPDRLRKKRHLLEVAAEAVRTLHDRQVFHADLNLKNLVLLDPVDSDPEVLVIDLDRARHGREVSPGQRWRNLFRLHRSLEKLQHGRGRISRSDCLRFVRAYLGRRVHGDRDLRRRLRWHRLALALRRVGWSLQAKRA